MTIGFLDGKSISLLASLGTLSLGAFLIGNIRYGSYIYHLQALLRRHSPKAITSERALRVALDADRTEAPPSAAAVDSRAPVAAPAGWSGFLSSWVELLSLVGWSLISHLPILARLAATDRQAAFLALEGTCVATPRLQAGRLVAPSDADLLLLGDTSRPAAHRILFNASEWQLQLKDDPSILLDVQLAPDTNQLYLDLPPLPNQPNTVQLRAKSRVMVIGMVQREASSSGSLPRYSLRSGYSVWGPWLAWLGPSYPLIVSQRPGGPEAMLDALLQYWHRWMAVSFSASLAFCACLTRQWLAFSAHRIASP